MKKAASIFLKPRKFIIAWFDNKCVAASCSYFRRTFCNTPDLDLQCWWKTKKININILIAKGGSLSPFSPPGCAFEPTYALQLLLGVPLKAEYGIMLWKILYERTINFSTKLPNLYPRKTLRRAPKKGAWGKCRTCLPLNTPLCITLTIISYENMKPIEHVLLHLICVLSHLMCECKHCNVKLSLYYWTH